MSKLGIFLIIILCYPTIISAQTGARYRDSTSLDVMTQESDARECYRAAGIAARIHYTTSRDLENCTYALQRGAMSPRDRAATYTNRGIIHMSLRNYDEAIVDYKTAMELRPDFGEIHINIGNVYFLGKSYFEAIDEYTAAIEKETSRIHIAYINRGMAYEKLGNFDRAEEDYLVAKELLPDAALPQLRLDELERVRREAPTSGTTEE
jgi:tetratricopeptide (TPR) repeat protein